MLDRFLALDRKQIDIASYILEVDPFYPFDLDEDPNISSSEKRSIADKRAVQFVSKLKYKNTPVADHLHTYLQDAVNESDNMQVKIKD